MPDLRTRGPFRRFPSVWAKRVTAGLSQAGVSAVFIIIVIVLLIIFTLALVEACRIRRPGGAALAAFISPPITTLAPGVPTRFQVQVAMAHPLPNVPTTFTVRIDEDDGWDDTLHQSVTVTYNPGNAARPYAVGEFTLTCQNLQADGTFDLVGNGTSSAEVTHQVHAEGDADSDNAIVRCAVPTIPVVRDDGAEGSVYCIYKVVTADSAGAEYINRKVCLRCINPTDGCASQVILDHADEGKWTASLLSSGCTACPSDAGAAVQRR